MSKRKKSSRAWLARHIDDPYVKLARKHQYRSRAAFKLIEIDAQDRLIRPGIAVVDLGAAPGAWCQVLRERLARAPEAGGGIHGRIVALDLLPMDPIPDVEFIEGDFREPQTLARLEQTLGGAKLDLVLSDMAPNLSGIAAVDAARMADLLDLALAFALAHLKPDGALLAKCFHGSGFSQVVESFKRSFVRVVVRKPGASRDRSAETYLLGRSLKAAATVPLPPVG
jgi:23S rRNA (uridine2552-2'-O)-methyltransferase